MLTASQFTYASPDDAFWRRAAIHCIEQATGKRRLRRLYEDYCRGPAVDDFFAEAVDRLGLQVKVSGNGLAGGLDAIPQQGPLVVVANHPYGVVDGLVLGYLISRIRPDFRILVNSVLYRLPEIRHHFLPIDFAETREALRTNLDSRRAALDDLSRGRCIAIFPGGTVSTAPSPLGQATDPEWKPFLARLIRESRATVLPIYFEGQNSRLFQWASLISMTLRLSLLFREVVNKMGSEMGAHIGAPITYDRLPEAPDRRILVEHLRQITYDLRPSKPDKHQISRAAP